MRCKIQIQTIRKKYNQIFGCFNEGNCYDLKALDRVFGRLFILMRSYVIWRCVPARAEWLRLCCGSWCMARTDEPLSAEHMVLEVTRLSVALNNTFQIASGTKCYRI
jgi:hypothetical protein